MVQTTYQLKLSPMRNYSKVSYHTYQRPSYWDLIECKTILIFIVRKKIIARFMARLFLNTSRNS
jgi:hypothetical protein